MTRAPLSIGQCAGLACLMEVTAPKPGNVHRGADFEDVGFFDFAASAIAIGPAMERAVEQPVGKTVLDAVQATRHWVGSNTNLGMILLLAPLASVPRSQPLSEGISAVLAGLNPQDAEWIYQAIRLAAPGGLGTVEQADIADEAPDDLLAAMRLAADRDLVAYQWSHDFEHVLQILPAWIDEGLRQEWPLQTIIVHVYVQMLAAQPDTLVARKCGHEMAEAVAARGQRILDAGPPGSEAYHRELADLDFWLRSDGHRRNPGTTADLVAAALFAALREGQLTPPWQFSAEAGAKNV